MIIVMDYALNPIENRLSLLDFQYCIMRKEFNSIAVIGGGSAGYLSALFLKKKFPLSNITIIESDKTPIIGVGEATTPLVTQFLHRQLGFSIQEFFKETKPTFKLGIRFEWGKEGNYHFNNTVGLNDLGSVVYQNESILNISLHSLLMEKNKGPVINNNGKLSPLNYPSGTSYHIDNKLLVKYFKKKTKESNISTWNTHINSFITDETNKVVSVISENEKREFDFYIDCSGFLSLTNSKIFRNKFISYSDVLFTNKAVIGTKKIPVTSDIKPYTSVKTLKHGWLWNTPTQSEEHLGYVFSDKFCTDEEARSELAEHCENVENAKIINFKSGRLEKSWNSNVVIIGNAFAFIEPLESTGLHMIVQQLIKFYTSQRKTKNIEAAKLAYNLNVNSRWDKLKEFIGMHFKYNQQNISPFWCACREKINLPNLEDYINFVKKHGPITLNQEKNKRIYDYINDDQVFGAFNYDLNLTGFGVVQSSVKLKQKKLVDQETKNKFNSMISSNCVSHREALAYFETNCVKDFKINNGKA